MRNVRNLILLWLILDMLFMAGWNVLKEIHRRKP